MRAINLASLCLYLTALALLGFALTRNQRQAVLPELSQQTLTDGSRLVVCDDATMARAFTQMGLPRPPLFSGMDPVPTEEILKRVRSWQKNGSSDHLGELGMIFLALSENQAALEYLAAARAQDPHNIWWGYYLGAACQKLGQRQKAVALFKVFLKNSGEHPVVLARLGMLQLELNNLDEALGYYRSFAKREPKQSMAHIGIGRVLLAQTQPKQALKVLQKAVALNYQDYLAYRFLARALIAEGREAEAREATQKAESLPQYNGWLMYDSRLEAAFALTRSQTYLNHQLQKAVGAKDLSRAHAMVDALLLRRPKDVDQYNNKARLHLQEQDPNGALAVAEKGLTLYPDHFELHLTRTRALFLSKEFEEMAHEVDILLSMQPNNPAVLDLQARCLFQKGDGPQAVTIMERAVALDRDNLGFHLVLGVMAANSGLGGKARAAFAEVLKKDPNNATAKAMLARLK